MTDKIEDWFYSTFSNICEITNIYIHTNRLDGLVMEGEHPNIFVRATIDYEINGKEKFIVYTETE
jgi:hypothetical protein